MANLNDKKWFIYVNDHHEGPFSVAEVETKIHQGTVDTSTFVWAEGMADWVEITHSAELKALFGAPRPAAPPPRNPTLPANSSSSGIQTQASIQLDVPVESSERFDIQVEVAPEAFTPLDMNEPTHTNGGSGISEFSKPEPIQAHSFAKKESTQELNRASENKPSGLQVKVDLLPKEEHTGEILRTKTKTADDITYSKIMAGSGTLSPEIAGTPRNKWLSPGGSRLILLSVVMVALFGTASYTGLLSQLSESPLMSGGFSGLKESFGPYLERATQRIPQLQKWVSFFPSISDVTPEEYQQLKGAADLILDDNGPNAEAVLSKGDPARPQFHIGVNLPESAKIEVHLIGIQGTLLNRVSFNSKQESIVSRHYAKTEPFSDNGQPLPKGRYQVFVVDADHQPENVGPIINGFKAQPALLPESISKNKRLVWTKEFFLGGLEDDAYKQRLKSYLDELQIKSKNTFDELKQMTLTLQTQMDWALKFNEKLQKGPRNPSNQKKWEVEAQKQKLIGLLDQMNKTFSQWTPEVLNERGYFKKLHNDLKIAGQAFFEFHSKQVEYILKGSGLAELAPSEIKAKTTLAQVIDSVQKIETADPPKGGLPKGLE